MQDSPATPAAEPNALRPDRPTPTRSPATSCAAAGCVARSERSDLDLLGECLARTTHLRASEAPHPQLDLHRLRTDRGVGQTALVMAMHSVRALTAVRARRGTPAGPRSDLDHHAHADDPLDDHASQMRQQDPATFGVTFTS